MLAQLRGELIFIYYCALKEGCGFVDARGGGDLYRPGILDGAL
jgi:hypothetical protein